MNRREVITALASVCSAVGVSPSATEVVCDSPEPILAVIHCDRSLPTRHIDRIREAWDRARKLHPKIPPCIVIEHGLRVEFVARGRDA